MILQIVGFKNSGKTTLMQHTIQFLKSYGYTIATIKHHGHIGEDITLQEDHVDHMKHFNPEQIKVLCKVNIINKLSRVHINKILLK